MHEHLCEVEHSSNLSSHNALVGEIKIPHIDQLQPILKLNKKPTPTQPQPLPAKSSPILIKLSETKSMNMTMTAIQNPIQYKIFQSNIKL